MRDRKFVNNTTGGRFPKLETTNWGRTVQTVTAWVACDDCDALGIVSRSLPNGCSVAAECRRCDGTGERALAVPNPNYDAEWPVFDNTPEGRERSRLFLWRRMIGKGLATDEDRPFTPLVGDPRMTQDERLERERLRAEMDRAFTKR